MISKVRGDTELKSLHINIEGYFLLICCSKFIQLSKAYVWYNGYSYRYLNTKV